MTVRIPFTDLASEHGRQEAEVMEAIARVVRSSRFVLGPETEAFERAAATYLGVEHAVGVSSGSDALVMALTAIGAGPGTEVVTTPFSFVATAESIVRAGATLRFADVDLATLCLDPASTEAVISPATRAILPVHLYGGMADVAELGAIAERRSLALVEDACQAFGTMGAGTTGALGCFSFFPTKVLGAFGDGGLLVTNSEEYAGTCRALRQHGRDAAGRHIARGGNYRLDALQAAVLSVKLERVDEGIAARRSHAAAYDRALSGIDGLALVGHERRTTSNGAVYAVRVLEGRRDELRAFLGARGVETAVYYERPLHLEPAFEALRVLEGSFPNAELAAREVVCLPVHPILTVQQTQRVIDAVREFFGV